MSRLINAKVEAKTHQPETRKEYLQRHVRTLEENKATCERDYAEGRIDKKTFALRHNDVCKALDERRRELAQENRGLKKRREAIR